jgi:hypothetical protein
MKLTLKWLATIFTVLLFLNLFIDTVPPKYKYRPAEGTADAETFTGYNDYQWTPEQITRAVLLALYVIVMVLAIWAVPEKSWVGLYFQRKRAEQQAKIAEAEARTAAFKKDRVTEESCL